MGPLQVTCYHGNQAIHGTPVIKTQGQRALPSWIGQLLYYSIYHDSVGFCNQKNKCHFNFLQLKEFHCYIFIVNVSVLSEIYSINHHTILFEFIRHHPGCVN